MMLDKLDERSTDISRFGGSPGATKINILHLEIFKQPWPTHGERLDKSIFHSNIPNNSELQLLHINWCLRSLVGCLNLRPLSEKQSILTCFKKPARQV